jgi:L-fuculokinase
MIKTRVIAIFDIGKTNKKFFLFDQKYQVLFQDSVQFPEIRDEEGFPTEDIQTLSAWVRDSLDQATSKSNMEIRAVNFSAYGASLVHINRKGEVLSPLYNYLKPFPRQLQHDFYEKFGGESGFSKSTASPVLGNLNAGLQLYRLKYLQPELFSRIYCSLFLPQYLSGLFTHQCYSDITSIGCHTGLWDFAKKHYHQWVYEENIQDLIATCFPSDHTVPIIWNDQELTAGIGLHDSSAALIPYQLSQAEPFVLVSTGTWCVSLNPFNDSPLTEEELTQDCLCYLDFRGSQVKASRLFAGHEHEQQVKRLSEYFALPPDHYKTIAFDRGIIEGLSRRPETELASKGLMMKESGFSGRAISMFDDFTMAYHQLMIDLVRQQALSTQLVLEGTRPRKIIVDGGFSKNSLYMHLLALAYPQHQVFAAVLPEASALGAALAIHPGWNPQPLPLRLVETKRY